MNSAFQWDLLCDRSHLTNLITTLQMVGGFLGAFLSGQLSDIYGRKNVLIGVYAIFCLSSLWSSFASSWIMYLVLKFIVGAAISGMYVNSFIINFAGRVLYLHLWRYKTKIHCLPYIDLIIPSLLCISIDILLSYFAWLLRVCWIK